MTRTHEYPRWIARIALPVALLAALLIAIVSMVSGSPTELLRYAQYERELTEIEDQSEQLDQTLDESNHRADLKVSLVDDYCAGRLDFPELVDRFDEINERNDDMMEMFRIRYPDCNDRLIAARNAAMFVMRAVPATGQARMRERLRSDFRSMFPDADPPDRDD
jgi:hypothetical protein